jgi:fructose/tagatose bisphosphate aldolase
MYPTHFQWLMSQAAEQNFPGVTDGPIPYNGNYANAAAIQTLFENAATTASATVVAGIDQAAMTATFTNVIQPLGNASLQDYTQKSWRMILLVENYNTSTKYCDAIGAVSVGWELEITDYQRKSKDGGDTHPTQLKIGAWSALYSDTDTLCSNYSAVCQHFGITPEGCPPSPG